MLLPILLAAASFAGAPDSSLVSAVNPFIGTDAHGHTYPGATVPFGMVQLSPDTRLTGWDGCSGYHYSDEVVYGFSHTHLSGTGVSDYGDILFMPMTGEPKLQNGSFGGPDMGYASRFTKESEHAEPGYYSVELSDYGIGVELTTTERTGLHRYRLPTGKPTHVILDLRHRDLVLDSHIEIIGDDEIVGHRRSNAWATDQVVFFSAKFSRPFRLQLARNDSLQANATRVEGTNCKAILGFGRGGGEVMVRVGISAVDIDGARRNAEAEIPRFRFDDVRAAAREKWSAAIDRFVVEGASDEERTVFATALYHSFLAPNLFSDIDGRYRGMDREIHQADGRDHYTVFSLWDTFRATHPLFTIVERARTRDFVQTMLAQYSEGGRLPVWELAGNETDCMIGYHSVSAIADAYAKGIDDFDTSLALQAMVDSAERDHFGLESYQRDGFIATDFESESVSKTAEYAYDDWCIAQFARQVGDYEVADHFEIRSKAWQHLFDPQTRFLRPRSNGGWMAPYDPRRVDFHHTEANGWQYRFAVQHDIESLIQACGGDDEFVAAVDSMFAMDSATTGREQSDITGLIGQYAHGNEPSHHVAWLYHYAGRPDRSAELVDRIRREMYTPQPDGLIGNEDCGQMSSWYVFAALGLYPVLPGSDEYVIVPPQFDSLSMDLESGERFAVRRQGTGTFVRAATLNGEVLTRSYLRHAEIMRGGELVLELGDAPSDWGQELGSRPHSRVPDAAILPAPWMTAPSVSFKDSMLVEFGAADDQALEFEASIEFDSGETQTTNARTIVLRESARIELKTRNPENGWASPAVRGSFTMIPHDWIVDVISTPNSQYTAGGAMALLDGRRGPEDWRTGSWQGYEGQDFVAVVDLGQVHRLDSVAAGFLQDVRSWIVMPENVVFELSDDGERYSSAMTVTHEVQPTRHGSFVVDLRQDLDGATARYIRVSAKNFGQLPDWHLGAGGDAFIFIDEIMIAAMPVDSEGAQR